MIQIPYTEVGLGLAIIFGVWAFLVADTVKERAVILGIPIAIMIITVVFRSRAGRLVSLVGWMLYGVGCIIYLRYNGMEIR
jgi:hypothetical protein